MGSVLDEKTAGSVDEIENSDIVMVNEMDVSDAVMRRRIMWKLDLTILPTLFLLFLFCKFFALGRLFAS
jgi:hypothetical protein